MSIYKSGDNVKFFILKLVFCCPFEKFWIVFQGTKMRNSGDEPGGTGQDARDGHFDLQVYNCECFGIKHQIIMTAKSLE